MLSLKPKHVARYVQIARLLTKYGHGEIVHSSGLRQALVDANYDEDVESNGKPEQFACDLEDLGPTFIKLGQLLSTRADVLPPEYLNALSRLQDDVDPVPFDDIREIVCHELGIRLSRGFKDFDEKPLAVASLGQVHRAQLRDGRDVVVKVQRPNIRGLIMDDLDAMTDLAEFLDEHTSFGRRYGLTTIVEALHDSILDELDYRQEASNAVTLRRNLASFELFVVPQPIEDYVTSRVITLEYISGTKITDASPAVLIERDRAKLADELFHAYLQQVLVDGVFHADPHPGNLALLRDGRIALLDFGMVVRVPPGLQKKLIKLLMTISEGRGEETAAAAKQIGEHGEDFDEPTFTRRITQLVAEHYDKPVEQLHAGTIVMQIQAVAGDCGHRLPNQVTMLGKALLNLDKLVSTLDPTFNPNKALRDRAAEVMQKHTTAQLSLGKLYHSMLEVTDLVQNLPERVNRITELVANNELKVNIDAIDERRLMSGMQKIANRITTGLVLAALIIGASLMMHLETSLTIFGYPAIALVFFLTAASCGVYLVFKTLFTDESDPKPR